MLLLRSKLYKYAKTFSQFWLFHIFFFLLFLRQLYPNFGYLFSVQPQNSLKKNLFCQIIIHFCSKIIYINKHLFNLYLLVKHHQLMLQNYIFRFNQQKIRLNFQILNFVNYWVLLCSQYSLNLSILKYLFFNLKKIIKLIIIIKIIKQILQQIEEFNFWFLDKLLFFLIDYY